nr:MAG: hypothetical protein [Molluscum contagiosum virus]
MLAVQPHEVGLPRLVLAIDDAQDVSRHAVDDLQDQAADAGVRVEDVHQLEHVLVHTALLEL